MFDKYGRGVITWTELSAVMKLLGFPNISTGLLGLAKIESNPSNSVGLDSKDIHKLLHSDELNSSLDYTFNRHNGLYNIRCIKKVVSIIVSGVLSLEDLHEARMSFILYEGELSNGIAMDEKTILSALRVTGKVVAPKKLQEWIKQLTPDVPGRIQLYEYFDLLKICDDKDGWMKLVNSSSSSNIEKRKNGLYELTDSSFLLTPDQKLLKKMDEEYDNMVTTLQVQQAVAREKSIKESNKSSNRDRGTKGVKVNNLLSTYDQIKDAISNTNDRVVKSRASKSLNDDDSKETKLLPSFSEGSLFSDKTLRAQSKVLSSGRNLPSVRFRKS